MRTIQSEIQRYGLSNQHMNVKTVPKVNEKLTNRELEELMGIRRPTYKRVRGAFRSK